MAAQDIRNVVGKSVAQADRSVQWEKIVDFAETPAASGDTLTFLTLRKGFVFLSHHAFLLTAEGASADIDIGVSGDVDGFLDGGSVNGSLNTLIASVGASATIAAGKLYATDTDVIITANAALDLAKVKIVFRGYMVDL